MYYYRATITKSIPSLTPVAVYNFSFVEGSSRDPIMECDLPWQGSRISSSWANSDMSLSVSNIPLTFMLSIKYSVNFSKLGKGELSCLAADILRQLNKVTNVSRRVAVQLIHRPGLHRALHFDTLRQSPPIRRSERIFLSKSCKELRHPQHYEVPESDIYLLLGLH